MKKLVIGGASALAVGVVGAGVYLANPASAGSTELTTASQQVADQIAGQPADQQAGQQTGRQPGDQASRRPGQRFRRRARILRLARRAGVHGEATVRTKKGFVQIAWQRGQLTAKNGGTLTVRSLDGTVWQWQTDDKTRVRKDGQKSTVSNLATNDFIVIAGQAAGGNKRTARAVIVPKRVPAKATQSPTPAPTS